MLIELVRLADSLGFFLYYTVWMLILGGIAVGGFYGRLARMPQVPFRRGTDILLSWFFAVALFSSLTANFAIVAAIGVRVLLEAGYAILLSAVQPGRKRSNAFVLPAAIVFVVLISSLWNPPATLGLLGVDNISLNAPRQLESNANVQDIQFSDLKDIRIVSQDYAAQLPKTELIETGYDVAGSFEAVDVFPENGKLDWISVYEPSVFLKYGVPSPYYVRINAFNPGDRDKVSASIKYSERNWLLSFIASKGHVLNTYLLLELAHPGYMYGDGYFVPGLNSWIYPYGITDYNLLPFTVVYKQLGLSVIDENGTVSLFELGSIPDKYNRYSTMDTNYAIARSVAWGNYHKWTDPLTYILSHPEIFEPAEDLFYQYDSDTGRFYALLQFEPVGNDRKGIVSWAEIEANGPDAGRITMYDARDLGLIGPVKAKSIIESEVSQYSKPGFEWAAFQPQFKYMKGRYVYVAPIYAGGGVSRTIKAVGIVDAKTEQVKILFWKDVLPEETADTKPAKGLPKGCELIYTTADSEIYACRK